MTMLRALFLSSLSLLRARWIRPTIQTTPIFPFSFHSVITIHHYGHRDDQGQTGTSCRAEDRRGNHLSFSSPSFPSSFLLCELSPRVSLSTLETLKNVVSIRKEEREVSKKGLIRLCSMLRYFSLSSFPFRDSGDFIDREIWRNTFSRCFFKKSV